MHTLEKPILQLKFGSVLFGDINLYSILIINWNHQLRNCYYQCINILSEKNICFIQFSACCVIFQIYIICKQLLLTADGFLPYSSMFVSFVTFIRLLSVLLQKIFLSLKSFSFVALWNHNLMPTMPRNASGYSSFKSQLKTFCFCAAFSKQPSICLWAMYFHVYAVWLCVCVLETVCP